MGLTLVTPPAEWPVSLEEAKAQCRVTGDHEDTLLERLIRSATAHVERTLDLSLTTRTYRLTLDAFTDTIELRRGPVQSVESLQYVDGDGITQTVSTEDYTVDLVSSSAWIVRNSGASWPAIMDAVNAVSVTYVAGFDELPSDLEDLKHAILLLIGHWFSVREAVDSGNAIPREIPLGVDALIQPHRKVLV